MNEPPPTSYQPPHSDIHPIYPGDRDNQFNYQSTPTPIYMDSPVAYRKISQPYYTITVIPSVAVPYAIDQYKIFERLTKTLLELSVKFNYADTRRQSQMVDNLAENIRSILP